jgi:hypothetical protein
MANTTGPQYSRGDQGQPTASNRYPTASPLAASSDPAGYQQTGDPYAQQPYSNEPYSNEPYANQPYPAQPGYQVQPYQGQPYQDQSYQDQRSRGYTSGRDTGPQRSREGEAYGYDYRYANGDLGDDRPGANATGWVALVLTLIALALTWDKFGAFIALPVLFLSFLLAQIALSKSGHRKWHAWVAVWLSVIGGFVALISVTVSLVGLMGGLNYSGGKSLLGIVDIPPVQIDRISDVEVSFPRSGLDSLTID